MKLKLSTLAIIVAIIFFGYYYFIDQAKAKPAVPVASPAPPPQPEPEAQDVEGTTQLEIENFYVEPPQYILLITVDEVDKYSVEFPKPVAVEAKTL